MHDFDLFHLFRRALALVMAVYVSVNTVSFLYRWLARGVDRSRTESFVRGYAITLFLRMRLRTFAGDFLQIAALTAVLAYLVSLHW